MRTGLATGAILCLLATAVMAPRLVSPQFGLLDDGLTVAAARGVMKNWSIVFQLGGETGRFTPAYWLAYASLYAVGDMNPFLWFLANCLLLVGITAGLVRLVRLRGGSSVECWTAGILFVLAGPVVENVYTLSKAESIQLAWIVVSLLLIELHVRVESSWPKGLLVLGTSTALLLSALTKETSLVLTLISIGWFLSAWYWAHSTSNMIGLEGRRWFLYATVISTGIYFGLRSNYMPLSPLEGTYASLYRLEYQRVLLSLSRWVAWLFRDFLYLAPLVALMGVSRVWRKQPQGMLALDASIWMAAWIAVFLPWHSLLEYYLLPFAFGSAVLGGVGVGQALASLRQASDKSVRVLAGCCLGVSLLLWQLTLANNVTNARLQLAVDEANSELLDFLATIPVDSVVLVNLPVPNEYVNEIELHLSQIRQRPDILVEYFTFEVASAPDGYMSYYLVTPQMNNQTQPSVRIAVHEGGADQWNQSVESFLGDEAEVVFRVERRVQLLDFGFDRLVCTLAEVIGELEPDIGLACKLPRPFIDSRVFSYGWRIHKVPGWMSSLDLRILDISYDS